MNDKKIKFALYIFAPFILIYFISMLIYPWAQGDWKHVQAVWDRWQSLNVGILAFTASCFALLASHHFSQAQHDLIIGQRERDFIAAKAFLPGALSVLCDYTEACIPPLEEAWQRDKDIGSRTPLLNPIPELPKDYKDIFKSCISLAPKEAGDHLSKILEKLQIQNSRLTEFSNNFKSASFTLMDNGTVLGKINDIAELRWLIDQTFDYARGRNRFFEEEKRPTNWDLEYNKLKLNGITIRDIRELRAHNDCKQSESEDF